MAIGVAWGDMAVCDYRSLCHSRHAAALRHRLMEMALRKQFFQQPGTYRDRSDRWG